jgi:hypothetical protein
VGRDPRRDVLLHRLPDSVRGSIASVIVVDLIINYADGAVEGRVATVCCSKFVCWSAQCSRLGNLRNAGLNFGDAGEGKGEVD